MIETEGLTHIHLVVRDLNRSVRFYRAVFGMAERFRVGPNMVFLSTPGSVSRGEHGPIRTRRARGRTAPMPRRAAGSALRGRRA